jgi:hypothetical protein
MDPASPPYANDRVTLAAGMAACALLTSMAVEVNTGYDPLALTLLTGGVILGLSAVILRPGEGVERFLFRWLATGLAAAALICACVLFYDTHNDRPIALGALILAVLGLLQVADLSAKRIPLLLVAVSVFCAVSTATFRSPARLKNPNIDVFLFHQGAANALLHGRDPYASRIPNIYRAENSAVFQDPLRYGPGTPYYGPGFVDDRGWLTYGYPYPPLSLLMIVPPYGLSGDSRFADVAAIALSALMMALARPGRWGPWAATLLLLTPQGFEVVDRSWTEPLLLCTFSLAMLCACRWPAAFPWALGLFCSTKQYTVLAVPMVFLLVHGPNSFKRFLGTWTKAALVVVAIALPFIAWSPHEFIRGVVQFQLAQPFRADSLSYLSWVYRIGGGYKGPVWIPFLAAAVAAGLALRRCPRTPAGFAAALALIFVMFFVFNKQAFGNYYYFVAGAALWSVAATDSDALTEVYGQAGIGPVAGLRGLMKVRIRRTSRHLSQSQNSRIVRYLAQLFARRRTRQIGRTTWTTNRGL